MTKGSGRDEAGHDTAGVMTIFERTYWLYILASRPGGALYVGSQTTYPGGFWEHRQRHGGDHTRRYGIQKLVYYESYPDVRDAIQRERTSSTGRGHGRRS